MMTMGFENPASASSGVSTPHTTSASAAHTATRSDLMRPLTNNMAARLRIMRVVVMGVRGL